MPPLRDIPALDGLRGIAATLVVGFHVIVYAVGLDPDGYNAGPLTAPAAMAWLKWGFIGVDFFFVLSAFLLSQPFLARGLDVDWRGYAGKRLLRVVPPYYASLVVGYLLVGHTGHPWFAMDWHQLWTHLTFLHGFFSDAQFSVSPVYWTLAVELQFYLLLPLLAIPFRGRHWPLALLAALAATLLYRWWVPVPGDEGLTRFHEAQLPAYLWHFALGIAMARLRHGARERIVGRGARDLGIVAAVALCIVLPSWLLGQEPTTFGLQDPLMVLVYRPLVALGFGFVILLSCSGPCATSSLLQTPPLTAVGRWSYSLYLVHYPLNAWMVLTWPALLDLTLGEQALVLTTAALFAATAFHALVEVPSLRLKEHVTRLRTRRGVIEPRPPVAP